MQTGASNSESIDAYISGFPPEVQTLLQQLRQTIQKAAPSAVEAISYQLPTFKLHGNLVHFAKYKSAKGSVQFPLTSRCRWLWLPRL